MRVHEGGLGWSAPLVMVFARFILGLASQGLVAASFWLMGKADPWRTAAGWWTVYTSLIDLGCLSLMAWFTHREKLRLVDLIGFDRTRARRDVLMGVGMTILVLPLVIVGILVSSQLIYGTTQAPVVSAKLPLGWALYSVILWPALWGITEQMTYNGYALPRLEALVGKRWQAVLIVMFGWLLQHTVLPFQWDWRWILFRFVEFIPLVVMPILYLRTRRLLPFIIAHWALDCLAALTLRLPH